MSLFFFLALSLLLLTLAILLRGLLGSNINAGSDPIDVNVEIAKENKKALEQALKTGELTQESFDQELSQLESTLASNITAATNKKANSKGQWFAAALIACGIPLSAGLLYLNIGEPGAITAQAQQPAPSTEPNAEGLPPLAELLPNLESRLQENPDDVRGWKLLGRSYLMVGQFDKAAEATRRALALEDTDADTHAQLAEAIAMQQQGDMQGEPIALVNAALAIDSNHQQATWLSAIADQQAGDHKSAISKFEKLLDATNDDPNAQQSIREMLSVSRAAINDSTTTEAPTSEASIVVSAAIADSITLDMPETTTVFIYARASSGPPMPLAVSRVQLKDLPINVTLDDSMAMVPGMTLSSFDSIIIGARISKTGNAIRQPGDWMGETDPVAVADNEQPISVTINSQVE
jgi:cytochrome c-type biogenesis protein CcmH